MNVREIFDWVLRLEPQVIGAFLSGVASKVGLDAYVKRVCRRISPCP